MNVYVVNSFEAIHCVPTRFGAICMNYVGPCPLIVFDEITLSISITESVTRLTCKNCSNGSPLSFFVD